LILSVANGWHSGTHSLLPKERHQLYRKSRELIFMSRLPNQSPEPTAVQEDLI
jgi:hypothetical protein